MTGYVEMKNTITNNSSFYLIVGNCHYVISQHKTMEEAEKAFQDINIHDTKYGSIWILEPNETRSGIFEKSIYDDSAFDYDVFKILGD